MTQDGTAASGVVRARRLRLGTVCAILAVNALALAAWTGTWVRGQVQDVPLEIAGDVAAPALPALALCGLALGAALTISGLLFRAVFGVLQVLLGISVALTGILVFADPGAAAAEAVTARTGITGDRGIAELLQNAAPTPVPAVVIGLGAASAMLGVLLLVTSRRWPGRSRRFTGTRAEAVGGGHVGEWDALSAGDDPTLDRRDPDADRDGDRGAAG